jgi:hypothetical protein
VDTASLAGVFGDLADYDGVMFVVQDPRGPAIVTYFTSRVQESYTWVRPDVGSAGDVTGPPGAADSTR